MAEQIILTGMVLSTMPIGEYDRRLVLLTKEKGKISAFAKGARRQNSQLIAGSRPFSFGEFTVYKGRNSYTVVSMNISNYFTELAADYYGTYYGFYFLELCDYYGRENVDGADTLNLLYYTFKALCNESIPNDLIRYIFELKIFVINGEYPGMYGCVKCGNDKDFNFFSPAFGGIICNDCKNTVGDLLELNPSTVYMMQYVITSPIEKLFTFTVSDNVLEELSLILEKYRQLYIDRKFKSLEILKEIQ